jgi:hypothetical protein
MLAYGSVVHSTDDPIKMEKMLPLECLKHLHSGVISCFDDKYSRRPTVDNLK